MAHEASFVVDEVGTRYHLGGAHLDWCILRVIKNLEVFELWSPEGIAVYMPATRSRERSGYSVIAHKDGGVKIRTQ